MKRNYIQPEVQVTSFALTGMICTSPAAPSMGLNLDPTDDQW